MNFTRILLIALLFFSQFSYAEQWITLVDNNQTSISYNSDEIFNENIGDKEYLGIWEKMTFKTPEKIEGVNGSIYTAVFLKLYQCQSKMASNDYSQIVFFGKDGNELGNYTTPSNELEFSYSIPDTHDYLVLNVGCVVDFAKKYKKATDSGADESTLNQLLEDYTFYLDKISKELADKDK